MATGLRRLFGHAFLLGFLFGCHFVDFRHPLTFVDGFLVALHLGATLGVIPLALIVLVFILVIFFVVALCGGHILFGIRLHTLLSHLCEGGLSGKFLLDKNCINRQIPGIRRVP